VRAQPTRRVVVVTGASAGVGRATAVAFARTGARLGLVARGRDGLEGARRNVQAAGGEALVVVADVADHEQVERAAVEAEDFLLKGKSERVVRQLFVRG
jgi:NADP-dependent 3-hydroxy acid dehydrogenase YdfG